MQNAQKKKKNKAKNWAENMKKGEKIKKTKKKRIDVMH